MYVAKYLGNNMHVHFIFMWELHYSGRVLHKPQIGRKVAFFSVWCSPPPLLLRKTPDRRQLVVSYHWEQLF